MVPLVTLRESLSRLKGVKQFELPQRIYFMHQLLRPI